jgi:hypothetical protein
MACSSGDSLERMGPAELVGLVRDLLGAVGRLRAANEALQGEVARLKSENQTLKDEIARLKHLPPRPPLTPSGMEKATEPSKPEGGEPGRRRRGPGVSRVTIDRTVELTVEAPAGSRRKGYEEIVVQDLTVAAETTLYRRERWETPDGRQIVAPLSESSVRIRRAGASSSINSARTAGSVASPQTMRCGPS